MRLFGGWLYLDWWRIRVWRLGVGWRAAAWTCRLKRFRNQPEPVRVLRAMHLWVQWDGGPQ